MTDQGFTVETRTVGRARAKDLRSRLEDAAKNACLIDEALEASKVDIHDPRRAISYDGVKVTHTPSNNPPTGDVRLHQAWLDCQQRIDAAHAALYRLGWHSRWQLAQRAEPVAVDAGILHSALSMLRAGIKWAQRRMERDLPLDASAAHAVCDQLRAALMCWPWHAELAAVEKVEKAPMCTNRVNGCLNPPRPGGSQCQVCANYRSKHQRDRVVGEDGRAA